MNLLILDNKHRDAVANQAHWNDVNGVSVVRHVERRKCMHLLHFRQTRQVHTF